MKNLCATIWNTALLATKEKDHRGGHCPGAACSCLLERLEGRGCVGNEVGFESKISRHPDARRDAVIGREADHDKSFNAGAPEISFGACSDCSPSAPMAQF